MKTIGILGTHGKTSILYLLESLFVECNKTVGVIGDFGFRMNKNQIANPYGKAVDVIKEMKRNQVEFLFIEIHENQPLIENLHFDSIVFCDYTKGKDTIQRSSFFRQSIDGAESIFVNTDSECTLPTIKEISNLYTITYGMNHKNTVTASSIEVVQKRMGYNYTLQRGFMTHSGKEVVVQEMPIELGIIGYQNIYNSLASITTALYYDLDIEKVVETLRNMSFIPNRLELSKLHHIPLLLDMASDSYAFKMLLEALQLLFYKKLYLVISIENINSLLKGSAIKDFLDDFSLIQGASIAVIGERKEEIIDKSSADLMVDEIIKNKLTFEYFDDLRSYLTKNLQKITEDDLLVWVGSSAVFRDLSRDQ